MVKRLRGREETMHEVEESYFSTEQGQIIVGAHQYIAAAKQLRYSDEWADKAELIQKPTLHLLCHGIELLLKFPLLVSGMPAQQVAKEFRHDLSSLWERPENARIRGLILEAAPKAWRRARESGQWPNENFDHDPQEVILKALSSLAHLHGSGSNHALRYIVEPGTTAPRSAFLIDVFGVVAEKVAKNPSCLTS